MLLLLMCALFGSTLCQEDNPIRDTIYGSVRGSTKQDEQGRSYEEYRSVPFGGPQSGDMRFEKPQPPDAWEGVRNATEFGPHCVQFVAAFYPVIGMTNETSEDCLTLDIYVPGENRVGDDLPVMVWFYGGGFFLGTSQMYPGYDLALRGDVIIVAANYRIGPIGWLSTEDDAAQGNYGLWDAQLALQWVADNIAGFGGDPTKVTVFGQSAGGAMTSHIMISPYTQGLFQRGIAISGSSSGYFGVAEPGGIAESTQTLARTMGCRRLNGSYEIVECLREEDATRLDFWGLASVIAFRQQLPNFIPRIDGDIIPIHPEESWSNGAASSVDFMSGSTKHDAAGLVLLAPLGGDQQLGNGSRNVAATKERLNLTMALVTNHYPGDTDEMRTAIFNKYPLMESDDLEIRTKATSDSTTDWWFSGGAHYETSQHARTADEGKNTYQYSFRYHPSFLTYEFDFVEGSHLDDIYSVLGEPFMKEWRDFLGTDFNEDDRLVNDYVSSYYLNFVNNGDPNIGIEVPEQWPIFSNETKNYLEFSTQPQVLQLTEEDDLQYFRFWRKEFPLVSHPSEDQIDLRNDKFNIDDYTDEEFELILMEGVAKLTELFTDMFAAFPEILEDFYNFVDKAVEDRAILSIQ